MTERPLSYLRPRTRFDYPYRFVMGGINGTFPTPMARDELRDWCSGNAATGRFRIQWDQRFGRLIVQFPDPTSAFVFKLRYQEDIIEEEEPKPVDVQP